MLSSPPSARAGFTRRISVEAFFSDESSSGRPLIRLTRAAQLRRRQRELNEQRAADAEREYADLVVAIEAEAATALQGALRRRVAKRRAAGLRQKRDERRQRLQTEEAIAFEVRRSRRRHPPPSRTPSPPLCALRPPR